MKELTIIIPLKEYEKSMGGFLDKAITSCGDNSIILIGKGVDNYEFTPKDRKTIIPTIKRIENSSDDLSYQHNVNMAVEHVKTEYFTVLEYDDEFSDIFCDAFKEYMGFENEKIFGYLPLTEVMDNETKEIIGYANEAFWASSFSERIGFVDIESLGEYLNFNASGAIFNTEKFKELGKLKESMKLVFWYEFLLRALYNGQKIFVMPKVGYYHLVNRKGSLSELYESTMSEDEADWWVDLAKKEYFFKNDRNKTYSE